MRVSGGELRSRSRSMRDLALCVWRLLHRRFLQAPPPPLLSSIQAMSLLNDCDRHTLIPFPNESLRLPAVSHSSTEISLSPLACMMRQTRSLHVCAYAFFPRSGCIDRRSRALGRQMITNIRGKHSVYSWPRR